MTAASLILFLAFAQAPAPDPLPPTVVGNWHLECSKTLQDEMRKAGLPTHSILIKIQPDATFTHKWAIGTSKIETAGTCTLKDGKITLATKGLFPYVGVPELVAEVKDDQLVIGGAIYTKIGPSDITGIWTLHVASGKEDPSISLKFTKEGRFSFSMGNAKSLGRYELGDGGIHLTYENVDGQQLEKEFTKTLAISEDGDVITVDDRFTYKRQGT